MSTPSFAPSTQGQIAPAVIDASGAGPLPDRVPHRGGSPAFAALGLHPDIVRAVVELGFEAPTPVQERTIPAFLQGRDLLVSSETGSGKTAAFMLPALHRIAQLPLSAEVAALRETPQREGANRRGPNRGRTRPGKNHRRALPSATTKKPLGPAAPQVLVLTPTRELAQQVTHAASAFGKYLRHIEVTSVLGGMPYPRQLDMLARMPDILVATPGRLLDHMGAGRIDLGALAMLVFDEADRMLDMGFEEDIDAVLAAAGSTRQTLMFSATFGSQVSALANRMLREPQRIVIRAAQPDQSHIEQRLHFVDNLQHKHRLLDHILRDVQMRQAIVFTATRRDADQLAQGLADNGYAVGALHGDMPQGARNRTLNALRRGDIDILVATDVAARGIDVPDISHVVNFDLPNQAEDYVHRIGRTGRAGRAGVAISLVNHAQACNWRRIEQFTKRRVPSTEIEGLEPRNASRETLPRLPKSSGTRSRGAAGNGGGRARRSDHTPARAGFAARRHETRSGSGAAMPRSVNKTNEGAAVPARVSLRATHAQHEDKAARSTRAHINTRTPGAIGGDASRRGATPPGAGRRGKMGAAGKPYVPKGRGQDRGWQ